jgi:hypothetical protein
MLNKNYSMIIMPHRLKVYRTSLVLYSFSGRNLVRGPLRPDALNGIDNGQ